jgi:integrase
MPRYSKHPYLKLNHKTWCFRYRIPPGVRHAFGGKHEYIRSLKTTDLAEAERRKQFHLDLIVNKIKAVREGSDDSLINAALYWRRQFKEADGFDDAQIEYQEQALEEAVDLYIDGGMSAVLAHAGANPIQHEVIASMPHGKLVLDFMNVVSGSKVPTTAYLDDWYSAYDAVEKTKDMAKSEVLRFAQEFPSVKEITKKAVTQWIDRRRQKGDSVSTIRRGITHLRQYWRYLQQLEEVPEEYDPFAGHRLRKKNGGQVEVLPYEPKEIVRLLKAAEEKKDKQLTDLIRIAIYSGMRIEEICALKIADVTTDRMNIKEAKTKSGIREVPIHSKLKDTFKRLRKVSKDGYLISGLKPNKYEKRHDAVGKRFGRLKTGLGFKSRQHTFHSFRHTVVTQLEQAGVEVSLIQRIVGHSTGTLALDTYSGGASFKQKKDAIQKISYPGI